jgi:hypothetical protein
MGNVAYYTNEFAGGPHTSSVMMLPF